jgi:hypothetical protein
MGWLKKKSRPALSVLGTANLAPCKPPSSSPNGRREPYAGAGTGGQPRGQI